MDALKFFKSVEWRFKASSGCATCPTRDLCTTDVSDVLKDVSDEKLLEIIEAIEKWDKENLENTQKTYKSVYLEKFPNADIFRCCVYNTFGEKHVQDCRNISCSECWNRPYEEQK